MYERARHRPILEIIEGQGLTSQPIARTDLWPTMGYCASKEVSPWFRVVETTDEQAVMAAKAVCDVCIVRQRCLAFGLALPESSDFGIWGGTTPEERVAIRASTVSKPDGVA